MAKIDRMLQRLVSLKAQVAELEAQRKELEEEIIASLDDNSASTIQFECEGVMHQATIVRSSTVKIDESGLESELSDRMWRQVTKRVLDERLLEDKVARGLIDIDVVAKHSTEVPRKPYVRLSGGKK